MFMLLEKIFEIEGVLIGDKYVLTHGRAELANLWHRSSMGTIVRQWACHQSNYSATHPDLSCLDYGTMIAFYRINVY